MKALLFRFKKIGVIILNIAIIVVLSYFIWQSEKFQQKISPQRYWQNKIASFEKELKNDSIKIKTLRLNLEKEISLSTYHEKQAKIEAEKIDESVGDIYFKIENDHIKKIKEIKNEIDHLKLQEEKLKHNLEIAILEKDTLK